jgi:hypothetical protein
MKLHVNLAITDTLRGRFKALVASYTKFFTNKQGAFKGIKKTYEPRDGYADDESMRADTPVVTSVNEKLDYFISESNEFIAALMAQEKTNAMGRATAKLIVDGNDWGTFTSLELLRLKSLISSSEIGDLYSMMLAIPTMEDTVLWSKSDKSEYKGRGIVESELLKGIKKSQESKEVILEDPNLPKMKDTSSYKPVTTVKRSIIEVGDYSTQRFSGEWTQHERAAALKRKNDLLTAVVKALKECNECEIEKSSLTGKKIFGYLFYGENK